MKKLYILCIASMLFLVLSGCADNHFIGNMQQSPPTEKSITVYEMTCDQYLEFLDLQSINYLKSNTTRYEYSIDAKDDKKIIRTKSADISSVDIYNEGVFRISHLPVYSSLIEFWCSAPQVQQYLQSHNISSTVDCVVFLESCCLPCSIGIFADSKWYFVTIDEYPEDIEQDKNGDLCVYRLYTHNEILKKFEIVDADLLINREKSLSVKMRYAYAEIPILALFKCLGANIQWNNDTITVKYNEQIIKLYPSKGRIELENGKQYGQEPPGGLAIFIVRDKEVYIDTGMAADLLKNFGVEMAWSREERAVYVDID